jgi:hypothetical protein
VLFQLFLALVSADLATFSVETLAAFALSQASLAALSSASRANIRAFAEVKATITQQKGERGQLAIMGRQTNKDIKVRSHRLQ